MIRESLKVSTNRLANSICMSSSGKYLAACTPNHFVYIWDKKGNQVLKRQDSTEIRDLLFFNNEEELAYICGNKRIVSCNLSDQDTWDFKIDISCMAISSDGKLLSCGTSLPGDKNFIYLIDRESSGLLSRKKGKISFKEKVSSHCLATAINNDGSKILYGLSNFHVLMVDSKGNHLSEINLKSNITCISITDEGNIIISATDGQLFCFDGNLNELWSKQFKKRDQFTAKISNDGNLIIATSTSNEIILLDNEGEIFWRINTKHAAPRITTNSDGSHFAFAISTDKSIRRYINESKDKDSMIPLYIQKLVNNDDSKFAVQMLKNWGASAYVDIIKSIQEDKFNEVHLEMISSFLDKTFFNKLLDTFLDDIDNLPVIKALDILNNYFEDLPQLLFDSMSDNKKLYAKMLEKISEYAFQRESPSMYRLLGIIYFKMQDWVSSSKYLIESLMYDQINGNTIKLLNLSQQNHMKEITLSKLKNDIYVPFSTLLFQ